MRSWHVATYARVALGGLLFWICADTGSAQTPPSPITLSGTSNVRDWSCAAPAVRAEIDAAGGFAAAVLSGQQAVHDAKVIVAVDSITCGSGIMEHHLRDALKAAENPDISFELDSYSLDTGQSAGADSAKVDGRLTIAGETRPVELAVAISGTEGGGLRVRGRQDLKMTDFGVKPPTLFFGTLKTADSVRVAFDVTIPEGGGRLATADPPIPQSVADTTELHAPLPIQDVRPLDQRGINVFETPKADFSTFDGVTLDFGAAFAADFQGLAHKNTAEPNVVDGVDVNELVDIGHGFNNSSANLYLDAALAPGIRVAVTTYLSSRHHQDTWVKGGYLQMDRLPIDFLPADVFMAFSTLKVGQFEINYGDAHFRRRDNGQALYDPFVGNLILDAFTTEIGGEWLVRPGPFIGMLGITGGEIQGYVSKPSQRSPAFYGKVGFDKQLTPVLRARLTASLFGQARGVDNTLYHGDRAGSPFVNVLENTQATTSEPAWSGTLDPLFGSEIHSFMINPFVKYGGLELFGVFERARGRAAGEPTVREFRQYDGDVIYRFLEDERFFVAGRFNTVTGRLPGITRDVRVNRAEVSAGWFMTPSMLAKAEYLDQRYRRFPSDDIRSGGRFHGFMLEGVVAF